MKISLLSERVYQHRDRTRHAFPTRILEGRPVGGLFSSLENSRINVLNGRDRVKSGRDEYVGIVARQIIGWRSIYSEARKFSGLALVSSSTEYNSLRFLQSILGVQCLDSVSFA